MRLDCLARDALTRLRELRSVAIRNTHLTTLLGATVAQWPHEIEIPIDGSSTLPGATLYTAPASGLALTLIQGENRFDFCQEYLENTQARIAQW